MFHPLLFGPILNYWHYSSTMCDLEHNFQIYLVADVFPIDTSADFTLVNVPIVTQASSAVIEAHAI